MLYQPKYDEQFDRTAAGSLDQLSERIQESALPTAALASAVVAEACPRVRSLGHAGRIIDQLADTGAWTDLALALIALEVPAWSVRRLVHEDGEWYCALSREPNLPIELDDMAEAHHLSLALALLAALIEVRRRTGIEREPRAPSVPRIACSNGCIANADNYM